MSSGIETNKIVGAILTALLVTVGIGHFGAALFDAGGHGEAELAYPVAAGTSETEPEEPEVIPTVLPLMADASAADGEALFGACRGCHSANEGGPNSVGPNLWNIVGRPIGGHEGYSYSDAMASMGGEWTYESLNEFLYRPRDFVEGTKMTYAGLPQLEARANLIAYLRSLSSDPAPLPTQEEIDSAVAAQQADAGGGEGTEEGGEAASGEGDAAGEAAPAEDGAAPEDAAPADTGDQATEPDASEEQQAEPEPAPAEQTTEPEAPADEEPAPDESAEEPAESDG